MKIKAKIPNLKNSKYSSIHNLAARKQSVNKYLKNNFENSTDPKITIEDIDDSVDMRNTFMMNTQTPYLDDKHVNILIHTTLDSSMDSD
mmetsp:Transcript_4633/g.3895  ORF Transcript_4633/g.3895 Transcript_4633/m.3895 type:complete len:89 (+) Transcript_4633:179-445(+)